MDRINNSHQKAPLINEESSSSSILLSNLLLDNFGEVVLTHNSDGLSWKSIDFIVNDHETCLGIKVGSNRVSAIRFSDIYAAEFLNWGLMRESSLTNPGVCFQSPCPELYRFSVHFVQRSKSQPSIWIPTVYTFGHINSKTCQMWVDRINTCLNVESDRPKSLLVFVHPRSGKENGCKAWKTVAPIFSHAKVKTKEIVTERPGHAFDVMANITNRELNSYDGVVAVGGDGFFSEILNGLLLTRHKASYPPRPTDSEEPVETKGTQDISSEGPVQCEDVTPLLNDKALVTNLRTDDESCYTEQDSEFSLPNKRFRIGIIPAGSTDAIVICTTGARDPITSALQIVLGKKVSIDIAQVVRWKITPTSKDEPYVRYAASFSGYGFYGDVITESEKYRWMGPKRYDYAGTKVFLRHSLYEAEVAYLETEPENPSSSEGSRVGRKKGLRALPCRANCNVCNTTIETSPEIPKWKRTRGNFISIGAAIISCRNEKAPDGLVAEAHLSDGFLHLILIKDCPRAYYLWHLTQLTRKGGHPLDFEFVEHIKTRAFTFTSFGKESVWNVDGEIVEAHQLSAQVFRGLVTLFATGPEV